ncbi:MAG: M24 family metallopeptidase C-terminal domain-containing protein, partial [Pseudomonadota bacterium]|nr:M24 family metallopeptidase C-terminal domain-containing protein [Pseudomonadota bacterium]
PIDTRLVDASMLTAAEKEWLNRYHVWALDKLSDALDEHERIWLAARCKAI